MVPTLSKLVNPNYYNLLGLNESQGDNNGKPEKEE